MYIYMKLVGETRYIERRAYLYSTCALPACQHVNRYLKNPSPRFSHSIHVSSGVLSHRFFILPPWHSFMCHIHTRIQFFVIMSGSSKSILRGDGVSKV